MNKVFLINLDRAKDRLARMQDILINAGIDFEVFSAVDGTAFDVSAFYSENNQEARGLRKLSAPELGCYLSHFFLWEKIIKENLPHAVILEDDITIEANLKELIEGALETCDSFDLIRLAGLGKVPFVRATKLTNTHELVTLLRGATGTQGYIISRRGALKLYRNAVPVTVPVDVYIDHNWLSGIKTLAIHPYPISENKVLESSITRERQATANHSNASMQATPRTKFLRWKQKRKIAVMKTLYYPIIASHALHLRLKLSFTAET